MSLTKVSYSMITGSPANVMDYGAKGDGTTDDTTAIQAALDSGAAWVFFPDASYLCGGLIVPIGVQKIYGPGQLLANANNVVVMQVVADTSRVKIKAIEGLRISGNSKTDVTGLKLGSTTNNPSAGAQEAVLYLAVRDVRVGLCATGIDSRVSMEHDFDNVVLISNTVGLKLYSDSVNGGGNANTFTAVRFQSNSVGAMLVSNSNYPMENNLFLGCLFQANSVCGLFAQGYSANGAIAGVSLTGFYVESNGLGGSPVVIDSITVKVADFYFVQSTVVLENADIASSLSPFVLAETNSKVAVTNLTGYGNPSGLVYSPDSTSLINEYGFGVGVGTKYIETYGSISNAGVGAVVGSPKMNLGFYRNDSTMANPAIPTLNNTTGATGTSIDKNANLGLMASIQFAASVGSTASNRNYWNCGNGTAGQYFVFSVIALASVNTTIRFYTLQTAIYKSLDVAFVANVPRRIVVTGTLLGTQGLQVYTYPTDTVGATLSFKAFEYVVDSSLAVINDAYQSGNCGVKTLNYEQLSAIPTTGTWARNEIVWNSAASASNPPGWICVASGTPGTWKAMANLAA